MTTQPSGAVTRPLNVAGYGRAQSLLVLMLPTLAAFSPLLPVVGPFYAFRLAVPLFALMILLPLKHTARSSIRAVILVLCWSWFIALFVLPIFNSLSRTGLTEITSVSVGLVLIMAVVLGPTGADAIMMWMRGWIVAFVITGAVALWELLTDSHLSNFYYFNLGLDVEQAEVQAAATFGNPNDYALFLVFSMPLLYIGRAGSVTRAARTGFTAALMVAPVLIYFTGSRISFALAIALGVILVASTSARWLRLGIIFALLVLVLGVIDQRWVSLLFGFGGEQIGAVVGGSTSWEVRLSLFLNGLDFLAQSNLVGIGPGAFEDHMAQGGKHETFGIINPHGGLIEVLSQYGLFITVALGVTLALLLALGWKSFRKFETRTFNQSTALSLILAVLAMPLATMAPSSTLDGSFQWVAFAIMGLLGSYLAAAKE